MSFWCTCVETHSFNFCENHTLAWLTFPFQARVTCWPVVTIVNFGSEGSELSDLVFKSLQIYLWGAFKFFLSQGTCLPLRSWSQGPGIKPCIGLPAQREVCFSLSSLLVFSLSQINPLKNSLFDLLIPIVTDLAGPFSFPHGLPFPEFPASSSLLSPSLPSFLGELCCQIRILEPWLRHAAPRTKMPGSRIREFLNWKSWFFQFRG